MNKFFGARYIAWERGSDNDWVARFYFEKFHYMTAYYTLEVEFESFEIEIHDDDIPKDMAEKVLSKYPNAKIFNVFEKIMELTTDSISVVEKEGQLFGIYFSNGVTTRVIPSDDYKFSSRIHIEND